MTASSTTVDVSGFTTDAKFRTWSSAVSAALLASGLTQTSDTGQINHTTVLRPTAAATKAGYEIWRFNDTLQATKPIFIRIDYGSSGNASGQNPGTWLTVGTGTDGAGTITGLGQAVIASSSSASASTNASMFVGAAYSTAAGTLVLAAGLLFTTNAHTGLWVVARTCDATTGAPDGNGVHVVQAASAAGPNVRGATFSPAVSYSSTVSPGVGVPQPSASVSSGSAVQLYKAYAILGILYPTMGFLAYYTTDIVSMTTFTAAPFGSTTRTYLALGAGNASGWCSAGSSGIVGAVIWE